MCDIKSQDGKMVYYVVSLAECHHALTHIFVLLLETKFSIFFQEIWAHIKYYSSIDIKCITKFKTTKPTHIHFQNISSSRTTIESSIDVVHYLVSFLS